MKILPSRDQQGNLPAGATFLMETPPSRGHLSSGDTSQ